MSREVRRVPPGWQHPRDHRGRYVPLLEDYAAASEGYRADPADYDYRAPDPADYMPSWPESVATAWCLYETTSEGTPLSPVFADREGLVDWLALGQPVGIGGRVLQLTPEQAAVFVDRGYAPTMVFTPSTGFRSGMEA